MNRAPKDTHFRTLVTNLEEVVFSLDVEGRVEYVSPASERVYGRTVEDVQGRLFAELVHPDDLAAVQAHFARTLTGMVEPIEFRGHDSAGKLHYLRTTTRARLEADRIVGVDGVLIDVTAVREAEEARRTSEAFLRTAFSVMPAAIAIVDLDNDLRFIEVNEAFEKMTGHRRDDVVGINSAALGLYVNGDQRSEVLRRIAVDGGFRDLLHEIRRKDGGSVAAMLSIATFQTDGKRYGITVSLDVTKERAAALELEQRLQFETLLGELAGSLIHLRDDRLEEAITHAQRRICEAYDLDRSSVMLPREGDGKLEVAQLFPAEVAIARRGELIEDHFPWSLVQLRRTGLPLAVPDVTALPPEAARDRAAYAQIGITSVLSVPWNDADGALHGVMNFSSVRGHVLTETQIRQVATLSQLMLVAVGRARERRSVSRGQERNRVLTEMLDEAPAGVIVFDDRGGVLYANRHAGAMHGYAPDERAPRTLADMLPVAGRAAGVERLTSVLARGEGSFLVWRVKQDGTPFHAQIRSLRTRWGDQDAVLSVLTDLTEREATEELRKARDAADAANHAKSRFLANMSHEIRTPMNAVLGFTSLLLRDAATTTSQRRHLETINRAGDHLMSLIDAVLQLAKVESGHDAVVESDFDLWSLAGDIEQLFQARASDKGLRLHAERDPAVPRFVRTDEGKLRQVLSNLLGNAIKFTAAGGVTLRLRACEAGGRPWLHVEVEDTGAGIGADEMPRLFQKFEQTASGRASHQGTGLGLAISRELVGLLGGTIGVESRLGAGSVFHFELPLTAAAELDVHARDAPPSTLRLAPDQGRRRVLVADDIEDNRTLLIQLLDALGFETRSCNDGAQAVRDFAVWCPHLILIDVRMPVMDGVEAIRRIRAMPGGDTVAIMCVSASAFPDEERGALAAGANRFVRKPVREGALLAEISALLGLRYVEAATAETPIEPLNRGALARLPAVLRTDLREATRRADLDAMLGVLDAIHTHDAVLASALRELAERFAYKRLLELLEVA